MDFDYDELLDHCIDSLLQSDVAAVDECLQHLPTHYYTFLFLRLNTMSNENLQNSLHNLFFNPHNKTILSSRTPATGLCCDELKRHNFTRCRIWVDSGLVNLEHLYEAWNNTLDCASPTTIEQGVVFFSQLPYYSAHANTVWSRSFERWLKQITDARFSVSPAPTLTSYVSHVVEAFVGVIANACEPIKSELFWRCAAKLDGMEQRDVLEDFLRCLVDHGCELNLPSYPFGEEKDTSTFIHDVEHRLFQLQGERLKRLAGIEDSGTDSGRRKI